MSNGEQIQSANIFNVIRFSNGSGVYHVKLTTGDDLKVFVGSRCRPNCRFIKVTRKGFNIVDLDTNRCILKKHTYAVGMSNKEFPKQGPITGSFPISMYITLIIKPKEVENAV